MALREGGPREWGTNLARVKDYNEVVVLGLVRSSGPIGRPAIAAATGLTLQTVSNISRRLLAAGTVVEDAAANGGRRKRALRINPDAGYAIGIQLVRSSLAVGVVDLAGEIRARAETAVEPEEPPEHVLARLAALVDEAVEAAGIDADKILGAGIGAPGPLDLRERHAAERPAPALLDATSRWPSAVADALKLRVIMDNDATAAALGEHWRGSATAPRASSTSTWAPGSAAGSCSTARPTAASAATPARSATSRSTRTARPASAAPTAASRSTRTPTGCSARPPRPRSTRRHRPGRRAAHDARGAHRAPRPAHPAGRATAPARTSPRSSSSAAACSIPS